MGVRGYFLRHLSATPESGRFEPPLGGGRRTLSPQKLLACVRRFGADEGILSAMGGPGVSTTMLARASWLKLLLGMSSIGLVLAIPIAAGHKLVGVVLAALLVIGVLAVFGPAMVSRRGLMWIADGYLRNALHVRPIPVANIVEVTYRRPDLQWVLLTTFGRGASRGSRAITVRTSSRAYDFPTSLMAAPEEVANRLRAVAGLPN
ncbi:MAG: hypothetical protein JWM33_1445 [Caulobacteraceae bacterium]|nr:hypothetical protein [Caulobacteraceae bacterium]